MAKITIEELKYDILFEFDEKEIKELTDAIKEIDDVIKELGDDANKAFEEMDDDIKKMAKEAERSLNRLDSSIDQVTDELDGLDDSADDLDLEEELRDSRREAGRLENSINDVGDETENLNNTVRGLAFFEVAKEISGELDQLGDQILEFNKDAFLTFATFDRAIKFAQVTFNATNEQMEESRKVISKLGSTTEKNALEIATAFNFIGLAGFELEESLGILPKSIDLSIVAGQDLASITDLLTDSISALGIDIKDLDKFMDSSIKTTQKSNTNLMQLFEAYLAVGGLAKDVGFSINQLQTELGLLANKGIKGAEGGVKLRNMILSLVSPTEKAAAFMDELGFSVTDAEGNFKEFDDIINNLSKELDGLSEKDRTEAISLIFNKADIKAVNALLADSGKTFDELEKQIIDSTGTASKAVELLKDSAAGDIESLRSAIEGAKISIGDETEDIFRPLIKQSTELLTEFNDTSSGFKDFLSITSLVSAGIFKMLPTIVALAAAYFIFGTALFTAIGVIAAVIAAVTAVIMIIKNWDVVTGFLKDKLGFLIDALKPFIEFVKVLGEAIWKLLVVAFKLLTRQFEILQPILKLIFEVFKLIGGILLGVFVVALDAIGVILKPIIQLFILFLNVIEFILDALEPFTKGVGDAIGKFADLIGKVNLFKKGAEGAVDIKSESTDNLKVGLLEDFEGGSFTPITKATNTTTQIKAEFAPQISITNDGEQITEEKIKRVISEEREKFFANMNNQFNPAF